MRAKTSRPLPDNRFQVQSTFDIHGYHIPSRTPQGKVNYLQMLDILKKYSESKGEYDARDISKDYKVDPVKIQNVVKYFQVLQVYLPPSQSRAGPLLSRERLGTSDRVPDQTEQPDPQGKITWGSSVLRDCFCSNCFCMWSGLCRIPESEHCKNRCTSWFLFFLLSLSYIVKFCFSDMMYLIL